MSKKAVRYAALIFLIISLFSAVFVFNACSGEKHPHELVKTERKEPTCTVAGNIEYWFCEECGKYFSDEKGKTEVTDVVLPAKGHTFEGKICTVCGAEKPSDGLKLVLSDDGKSYRVSGIGTCTDTDIVIPDTYRGLPVTAICEFAFFDTIAKNISIPDSVTSIGDLAFSGCTSLTSITIPDSVTSIGNRAFWGCTSLTSITIPDSVTSIGEYAFSGCTSLTGVYIYNISAWCSIKFESYDSNPLYYAHKLYLNNQLVTDLIIPDSVTSIGSFAFEGCTSLTSITIPGSVTSIESSAFSGCTSLTSAVFENTTGWRVDNYNVVVTNPTVNAENLVSLSGTWTRIE